MASSLFSEERGGKLEIYRFPISGILCRGPCYCERNKWKAVFHGRKMMLSEAKLQVVPMRGEKLSTTCPDDILVSDTKFLKWFCVEV